jgi:protein-S-isoprenylcysteine O-methyltransferase Ste14
MKKPVAAAGSSMFFALAPGTVAGVGPWLLTGWQSHDPWLPMQIAGLLLIGAGSVVLLHAFARFVREGLGTPAPVAPTERLVVGGLYRYVRNPMYVAVASTIFGQALVLGRLVLVLYAVAFMLAVWSFVHWYEEPTLERRFGGAYRDYRDAVPAWWPRLRRHAES